MPIKKTRLTQEEQAWHLERVRELQAAGLDCELPNESRGVSHALEISINPPEGNILCELPSGVTAYAIGAHLIALRGNVRLENCTIESAWDSKSITLCPDQRGLYRVGQAVNFTEGEVLNNRIENGLCFHKRGDVAEGWLVASGLTPIPDQYRDWMTTKLIITFTDQFGHDYCERAEAFVQRWEGLRNIAHVRKSPGLFEAGPKTEIQSRQETTSPSDWQPHGTTKPIMDDRGRTRL